MQGLFELPNVESDSHTGIGETVKKIEKDYGATIRQVNMMQVWIFLVIDESALELLDKRILVKSINIFRRTIV